MASGATLTALSFRTRSFVESVKERARQIGRLGVTPKQFPYHLAYACYLKRFMVIFTEDTTPNVKSMTNFITLLDMALLTLRDNNYKWEDLPLLFGTIYQQVGRCIHNIDYFYLAHKCYKLHETKFENNKHNNPKKLPKYHEQNMLMRKMFWPKHTAELLTVKASFECGIEFLRCSEFKHAIKYFNECIDFFFNSKNTLLYSLYDSQIAFEFIIELCYSYRLIWKHNCGVMVSKKQKQKRLPPNPNLLHVLFGLVRHIDEYYENAKFLKLDMYFKVYHCIARYYYEFPTIVEKFQKSKQFGLLSLKYSKKMLALGTVNVGYILPTLSELYILLIKVCFMLGEREESMKYLQRSMELESLCPGSRIANGCKKYMIDFQKILFSFESPNMWIWHLWEDGFGEVLT